MYLNFLVFLQGKQQKTETIEEDVEDQDLAIREMEKKLVQQEISGKRKIEEQKLKNKLIKEACFKQEQNIWKENNSDMGCESYYMFSGLFGGKQRRWKIDNYFIKENSNQIDQTSSEVSLFLDK